MFFGSTTNFSISRIALTRSETNEADTTISMYVPKPIEFVFPSVTSEQETYPLCYYKDLEIEWNADSNNTNGIVVAVEWNGTMIFGANYPDTYIRRVDVINEDNGHAVLNNELFEDIPDTALVTISILRGNIENILIDDYSYKLIAESHAVLQIILIRDII